MAAVLACGPGAVLSHRSALDLHGVRPMSRSRHEVMRVGGSTIRTVEVHRTRSLPPEDVCEIRGISVTTLARALCDCTPLLSEQALVRCIHEAEILRVLDVAAIRDPPKRLASLIAGYSPQPANEGLETLFAAILPDDLPRHEFNAYVGTIEVDVLFPAQRVVVELDDVRTHRTARAFQRDRERDAALAAQGYVVLRITYERLTRDPAGVIRDLRGALAAAPGSRAP
ncbi:MAG: DUF559 domain-containing protein [Solirubrobacteraceae bacterium]